jgi:hypothetical protein
MTKDMVEQDYVMVKGMTGFAFENGADQSKLEGASTIS